MQKVSRFEDPAWYPRTADGVETNEVADGYIVYQPERGRVHYLNHTAAILLALCNGKSAVTEFPDLVQEAFGLSTLPTADIRECLEQLLAEGLII
jgi:Coenzyme PQQ synthesis protein D (PqqD)